MTDIQLTLQDLEKKGQEIYESKLKQYLEKEHFGKYVAIEVESGDYFFLLTQENTGSFAIKAAVIAETAVKAININSR